MGSFAAKNSDQTGTCRVYHRRAGTWNLLVIRITGDLKLDDADRLVLPAFDAIPGCSRVVLEVSDMREPGYPLLFLTCLIHRYAMLFEKKFSISYESPELQQRVAMYVDSHREAGCIFVPGRQCISGEKNRMTGVRSVAGDAGQASLLTVATGTRRR